MCKGNLVEEMARILVEEEGLNPQKVQEPFKDFEGF